MAFVHEMRLSDRIFVRTYPWRRIDPVPWTALAKPLTSCRLAVVSSAGFVLPGQEPFDASVRGGDYGFRVIPSGAAARTLVDSHRSGSYDHAGVRADPNLGFPIDRVRELAASGRIGSVAPRHLSFMGSITAPGRLKDRTAPEAARLLVEDQVDVAILVPV